MIDFSSFVQDALAASLEIQQKLLENSSSLYQKHTLGAGGDISYGADLIAEQIYISYLSSYAQIDSEESGIIGDGTHIIYLDPLDGSDNFKSNFPYYGASIALCSGKIPLVALVVNFISSEVFVRTQTQAYKTYLNSLTCKQNLAENRSLSSIGIVEKAYDYPEKIAILKEHGLKFRSPGAVALSLAYASYAAYMLFFGIGRAHV